MVQLNELISGDEFVITKPWNGFEAGTRFVMEGRTDVFVYGPKWFDVHPRGKEDDVWMMENMEVKSAEADARHHRSPVQPAGMAGWRVRIFEILCKGRSPYSADACPTLGRPPRTPAGAPTQHRPRARPPGNLLVQRAYAGRNQSPRRSLPMGRIAR